MFHAPDFWLHRGLASTLLLPFSWLYRVAVWWRGWRARPISPPMPVVCVGNLTAGGAGKTPAVIALAKGLQARGIQLQVLSRGYGGSRTGPLQVDPDRHSFHDVGDEPLLIAAHVPCWVARDRVAGARAAAGAGAEIILMDDGLQNPALRKTLGLVVIDGAYGFGNGRLIPAGPLREPVASGLAKADAVLLVGEDTAGVGAQLPPGVPVMHAHIVPDEPTMLAGQPVFAFAGIARPEKFYQTLRELECRLVGTRDFPDHHVYSERELEALTQDAREQGARLVTTEKDAVRLPVAYRSSVDVLPVRMVLAEADLAFILSLLEKSRHEATGAL